METLAGQVPLILLVFSRVAGVTAVSPVFASRFMPLPVRAAFSFLLALFVFPSARPAPGATEGAGLLLGCALEFFVGLLIGFLNYLVFAVMEMAGAMLDTDMGFSMAQILDPVTGRSSPILTTFFQTLGVTIYLAMNGHHWLLRGLAGSYQTSLAGAIPAGAESSLQVVQLFGTYLGAAVQMVLPFTAAMLLASMALAGVNRAAPQMNIFSVGMGLKAVIGFIMLALLVPYLLGFLEALFAHGQSDLLRILHQVQSQP